MWDICCFVQNRKLLKKKGVEKIGSLGFCWSAMMTLKQGADSSYGKKLVCFALLQNGTWINSSRHCVSRGITWYSADTLWRESVCYWWQMRTPGLLIFITVSQTQKHFFFCCMCTCVLHLWLWCVYRVHIYASESMLRAKDSKLCFTIFPVICGRIRMNACNQRLKHATSHVKENHTRNLSQPRL
jgi:hypothetical protein